MINRTNFFFLLLISSVLHGLFFPNKSEISIGHKDTEGLNKNDACGHVHSYSEKKAKMGEIELNGTKRQCCYCNPGMKLVDLCL